ncbi:hypothetical protein JXJ21_17295 [candidate division KSB1 bacterium]|nr:hypothetical protein [candidate division KSB1 bacterium]
MTMLSGAQVVDFVGNLIDKGKQERKFSIDLTAKSITQLEGRGRIDFGGSEFEWGQRTVLSPKRLNPQETFGWWKLTKGEYIIRLNESVILPAGYLGLVLPHERIVLNGAHHPMLLLQSTVEHVEVLLCVSEVGIDIKENARISSLNAFKIG